MTLTAISPFGRLLDWLIPAYPISATAGPAFFACSSHKSAVVDGRHVCPLIDPLIEETAGDYTYITIGSLPGPEKIPSQHVKRQLHWPEFIASLLVFRRGDLNDFRFLWRLMNSKDLCLTLGSDQQQGAPVRRWWFATRAFLLARYFALKFRAIAANAGCAHVVVYYNAMMLGVVRAFREAGKPVWDVQHGYLGPHHDAYNNVYAYAIDSNLKPTGFLVWDDSFGRYIETTFGLPWRSTDYHHLRHDRSSSGDQPSGTVILYSLQWGTPVPAEVEHAIRHFGDSVTWIFRAHPLEPELRADLQWLMQFDNVALAGTSEPLHAALRRCTVHVTYNSGVIHEAAALGIPTCFLDRGFVNRVVKELDDGLAFFGGDGRLCTLITQLRPSRSLDS